MNATESRQPRSWPSLVIRVRLLGCWAAMLRRHTLDLPPMPVSTMTFYAGWDEHNALLESALSELNARQLSLQAAPHLWSIRMLANHIVAARAWWFGAWMGEGDGQLAQLREYDEGVESDQRDAATIVGALHKTR